MKVVTVQRASIYFPTSQFLPRKISATCDWLVDKFEMNLLGDKQERGSLNDRQGLQELHQRIPAWEMKHVKNHVALPRVEVPSYNREAASVPRR
jgi:hypothetical protein